MAIGLASLQVVLEEGSRKDWFNSSLIINLSAIALVFLALFSGLNSRASNHLLIYVSCIIETSALLALSMYR